MQEQVPRPDGARPERVAFKEGFLHGSLARLDGLRLLGSRCAECGIALWGRRRRCENCSSTQVGEEVFASSGSVHTYTVQRFAPPKPHALPLPWTPRPVAWIDLDDGGPRVLAPIACAADDVSIGMRVRLSCSVGWLDEAGREVIVYNFEPLP